MNMDNLHMDIIVTLVVLLCLTGTYGQVGDCPSTEGMIGICMEGCSTTAQDCDVGYKCCSNGCGHVCTDVRCPIGSPLREGPQDPELFCGLGSKSVKCPEGYFCSSHSTGAFAVCCVNPEYCDAERFDAQCQQNEVIYMQTALFGRMRIGRCVHKDYGHVGCGQDVLDIADQICSGRHNCSIHVPNSAFKKYTGCPKDLKPYFEVGYQCIEVETAPEQHCESSGLLLPSSTSGYLSNLVTMETHKGSARCPWMIQAQFGQKINFTIYDFARRGDSPDLLICHKSAVIREFQTSSTTVICRRDQRIAHAYTTTKHEVEVWIPDTNDGYNYLIKYEIIGCSDPDLPKHAVMERHDDVVEIRCPATNQNWRLICDGNAWSGTYGNCTQVTDGASSMYGTLWSLMCTYWLLG